MPEKRQIAIVLYPGFTALDALGPYEVLKLLARHRDPVRGACGGTDFNRPRSS